MVTTAIFVAAERCTGCGACVDVCPRGALYLEGGTAHLHAERCTGCEACIEACPVHAIYAVQEPAELMPAKGQAPEALQAARALKARPAWLVGLGAMVSVAERLLPALARVVTTLRADRPVDDTATECEQMVDGTSPASAHGQHRHRRGRG